MAVFVITGASTGVGEACAMHFAGQGHTVWALARNRQKLEALAQEAAGRVKPLCCDVSSVEAVKQAFGRIGEESQKVDVLINNAGIMETTWEIDRIDAIVDTNLKGTMYCTYAVLPLMRAAGKGNIVNIASISGVDISPDGNNGLYAATKYGTVAFADSIGRVLKKEDILVTTLCPGGIDTPLWNESFQYPKEKEGMIQPREVAELVEYVINQPRRTLFKNLVFIPTQEDW